MAAADLLPCVRIYPRCWLQLSQDSGIVVQLGK